MQHRRKKNKTMEHNNTQEKLLYELQVADFALHECVLYLDGHPYDRAAKEYYNKMLRKRKALEQEYEEKYGPITYYGNTSDSWQWNDGPWPWENEASMNRAKQAGRTISNANIAMTQKERR